MTAAALLALQLMAQTGEGRVTAYFTPAESVVGLARGQFWARLGLIAPLPGDSTPALQVELTRGASWGCTETLPAFCPTIYSLGVGTEWLKRGLFVAPRLNFALGAGAPDRIPRGGQAAGWLGVDLGARGIWGPLYLAVVLTPHAGYGSEAFKYGGPDWAGPLSLSTSGPFFVGASANLRVGLTLDLAELR